MVCDPRAAGYDLGQVVTLDNTIIPLALVIAAKLTKQNENNNQNNNQQ